MSKPTQITPNLDYPNNEPADLITENVNLAEAEAIGAPKHSKMPRKGEDSQSAKSRMERQEKQKLPTIEEQENEDLEVDEDLEPGMPEQPGNVPRF